LIRSHVSLVSAGTERMLLDFGKASLIGKARQQPEKVAQVLEKMKADGLIPTLEAITGKLSEPISLGYCNVGTVLSIGAGVQGFGPGDRVASNGKHAEIVNVPQMLCAKVPDGVSDDEAAFTTIGAIALQGIRLAAPTLGETVVVTGLGLIGLLSVQLLRAQGCRVLGLDYNETRLRLGQSFGAEIVKLSDGADPVAAAFDYSRGRGVDAVIITAATSSNEPVQQAARMCRKRGRLVLVGVAGLELKRSDFYEKELTFQVSCSYGPGRYDPAYEHKGHDYPIGFVRWTEQRNFEAFFDMLAERRLNVRSLVSHRFPIAAAAKAYEALGTTETALGILLDYERQDRKTDESLLESTISLVQRPRPAATNMFVGFIGAGNYASRVLAPAFKSAGAVLEIAASSAGLSAAQLARKHGFASATTDLDRVFEDERIPTVAIATRHDSHAKLVLRALQAGKNVFVEKPLCLTEIELDAICEAFASTAKQPLLMVGFNRRFAPQARMIKSLLETVTGPKCFIMTVNAGRVPEDHWSQDKQIGGGRIVGEACHFIDLLRFFAGTPISDFGRSARSSQTDDTVSLQLAFADGSIGTVHYFANGSRRFPKERLEVFCAGRILQLNNFRKLRGFGWPGFRRLSLWRQDKGQSAAVVAFMEAVRSGGASPIPFDELIEVARVTIGLAEPMPRRLPAFSSPAANSPN
jgi:predicted dehydrogenase/threonine dehydrogenase-like Zn-dependent dehydrogenase